MSHNTTEEEFNDYNTFIIVKVVTKLSESLSCGNESHQFVEDEEWDELIDKVKEQKKLILNGNMRHLDANIELSLAIECPNLGSDIPLFLCLCQ